MCKRAEWLDTHEATPPTNKMITSIATANFNESTKVKNPRRIDFLYWRYTILDTYSSLHVIELWGTPRPQHHTTHRSITITWVWLQEHARAIANRKEKAAKLSSYIATYGGESVNLQELLLKLHTLYLEKSPVLFVLSIKNFLESMEDSGWK